MNKLRGFLILFLIIFMYSKSYCSDIIIKYIVDKDTSEHTTSSVSEYILDIIKNGKDPVDLNSKLGLPKTKTIVVNNEKEEIIIISYKITHSGIYFITDLLGHEILLDQSMDKDTIVLRLQRPDKNHIIYLNDTVKRTCLYDITYPSKYKYMGFFDELANLHGRFGRVGGGYTFKEYNQDLPKYINKVRQVYNDRRRFYNNFVRKYDIPAKLKYYVLKEIQYSYFDDLTDPLVLWDGTLIKEYPKDLLDSIYNIGHSLHDKELFENTSLYRRVALDYMYLTGFQNGSIKSLSDHVDSTFLIDRMNFCKKNFDGVTQTYSLARLMQTTSKLNLPNTFSSLYNSYDHSLAVEGTNKLVDSLYTIVLHSENINEKIILNFNFEDINHKVCKLSDIFNKDIILLDCWATWCVPCREQMPALNLLTNEFKNRVQFISISADQITAKWDNWIVKDAKANKAITQLHAPNGFKNAFFSRLLISSIPRYILLSKSGKILNVAMPYPSQKEEFKAELKKYL